MNRFALILLAILITAIGATATSLVWTGTASADGNGELTFVEFHKDGVDDVDGLSLAVSVTVSPDGKHLYAAGSSDNAVAVFSRNSTSGELSFVQVVKDGEGGVDGLNGAFSVTVSPDGKHLYAASQFDDAVAVFSRNLTTGTLTFVKVHKDGLDGVDGLNSSRSVTASPDGRQIYIVGIDGNAVAVFSRNSTTGKLTFVEVVKDDEGGVDGLNGSFSVTVSPDGKHLYAAGARDNAVAVFSRDTTIPSADLEVTKTGSPRTL
jgi:6-phosphogluconolactonase (cycloisomerase 2 family)